MALPSVEQLVDKVEGGSQEPQSQPQDQTPQDQSGKTQEQQEQEALDLAKVQKFKFEGQEMTYEDLKKAYLRQQDYTRKTQALSEERKSWDQKTQYWSNLDADLASVKANPALAAQFKSIYPEEFHKYLRYVANEQEAQTQQTAQAQQVLNNPIYDQRLTQLEQMIVAKEAQAMESQLAAQDEKMQAKYPLADPEKVYAKAQTLHKNGTQLDEQVWDKLWKSAHEADLKRYQAHYKEQVTKQQSANQKGRDMAPGGGMAGQAPVKAKFKDVKNIIINDLETRNAN